MLDGKSSKLDCRAFLGNKRVWDYPKNENRAFRQLAGTPCFSGVGGRTFEEKKEALLIHLQERRDAEPAEVLANCAIADKIGQQVKAEFLSFGIVICPDASIILRDVYEGDREGFLPIQQENSPLKEMMKEEVYCDMVRKEHLGDK